MINYKSTAFSYRQVVNGKVVLGNPSSIFILEDNEEFSRETMSELGVSENYPITCFVKRIDNSNKNYDIFYYNLDGSQAYMCGSGNMSTAFILNRLFNVNRVNFYFDTAPFKVKISDNLIVADIENDGIVFLERKTHDFLPMIEWDESIESIVESFLIDRSSIVEILRAPELNDLIFVLDDNMVLRKMKPDFAKMAIILERLDMRNLCVTALGSQEQFDFETRIFVPHDNLNEDLACGSSSLAIAKYWSEKTGKNSFNVLFPYHMEYDDQTIGGVQFIKIQDNKTMVGGYCDSITQNFRILKHPGCSRLVYTSTFDYAELQTT
ncbi:MAG: PhzF family phenazine biosynthesis protein [Rickettsiales bacterium]|jgi:PhzF family phenazine biosynthesis protein|nr:PhzF family phenazine biosynthesis protein [Rickettsiales bacterium]